MEAKAIQVGKLFSDGDIIYQIPIFQRHYVWNEENQFAQIWEDIQSKISERLDPSEETSSHYMGSIVIESSGKPSSLKIPRWNVIDGQQRLTTIQIIFAVLRDISEYLQEFYSEPNITKTILNDINRHQENVNEHLMHDKDTEWMKVLPTKYDHEVFHDILTLGSRDEVVNKYPHCFTRRKELYKNNPQKDNTPKILAAYVFFYDAFLDFVLRDENEEYREINEIQNLISTMYQTILDDLVIVKIELASKDDPQVIFETLNAGGTPLLASDLIRNHIFLKCQSGTCKSVQVLYDSYWKNFEIDFWTSQEKQGRIRRARLELFCAHFLSAKTGIEINISQLFQEYKKFSSFVSDVEDELKELICYSSSYKFLSIDEISTSLTHIGFWLRLFDVTTAYPLILKVDQEISDANEKEMIFKDIISYIVRRAVCGLTTKGYNKFFIQVVKHLKSAGTTCNSIKDFMIRQTSNTTRWPDDDEFEKNWINSPVYYYYINSKRIKYLLLEIDKQMRPKFCETVSINPEGLTVEHVMPQTWYDNWPIYDSSFVTQEEINIARWSPKNDRDNFINTREELVNSFGNLSLLTQPLNSSVSNSNFLTKKKDIISNSALALNAYFQEIMDWNEEAIKARAKVLFEKAKEIWPHPGKISD